MKYLLLLCSFAAFAQKSIAPLIQSSEAIKGKAEFLHTPFVTAGDKLYLVGHQDGTFPPLGWHVKDEMGGIWAHPIKLWDGFTAAYTVGGKHVVLDRANQFINHPFANEHLYEGADIQVRRFQFVPDGKAAVYVEYVLENKTNQTQEIQFSMEAVSNLRPVWLGERTGMEDGADELVYENNQVLAKDAKNQWFAVMGASHNAISNVMEGGKKQNTALVRTSYTLQIPAHSHQSISFVFSGSSVSKEAAIGTNSDVLANGFVYA
ncbi:MAG: hypothetical protein RJB49_1437, partial [Bacteroidota bacterium]